VEGSVFPYVPVSPVSAMTSAILNVLIPTYILGPLGIIHLFLKSWGHEKYFLHMLVGRKL
jgi:hypothetical protein